MNVRDVISLIAGKSVTAIENAWLAGIEEQAPPEQMRQVLDELVKAKQSDTAHTLAWMLLSETVEQHGPARGLTVARDVLTAVPGNDELRTMLADLYRDAHGRAEHFDDFLGASGLIETQSLRRAIRTLETALAVTPGCFLANRYDNRVVRAGRFNAVMGCFEVTAADGADEQIEPRPLADEFDIVDENDFRVLCQFRKDEMGEILAKNPAGVLMGICMSYGGQISMPDLKDLLVPKYIEDGKWTGWRGRARTAAKRSQNLTIEGRNPTIVSYHPGGRSPEEQLADAVENARTPLAFRDILRQYASETHSRKLPLDPTFVEPIMRMLAHHAESYRRRRPIDALTASMVIDAMVADGMPPPPTEYPSTVEAIGALGDPAKVILDLPDASLWPVAIEALARRDDAADQYEKLLTAMPAAQLDDIAGRIRAAGRGEAVAQAVENAVLNAGKNLQICLWLWKGPAEEVAAAPSELNLLSRLLGVMEQISHDMTIARNVRRETYQQIRAALVADNCKTFRKAVAEMDQDVAGTIKRRIAQSPGLSPSAHEKLMSILREEFYGLFLKARVEPWLDETVIYSSEAAVRKREAELKYLTEVAVPENSKRVGAAAALGDLSENSEWESAVEEQRRLLARVANMRDELAIVRVLHPKEYPTDRVGIGSKVALTPVDGGDDVVVRFLGPWDGDVAKRIFNYKAAIAQEMMGKTVGETVTMRLDDVGGEYVIKELGAALEEHPGQ